MYRLPQTETFAKWLGRLRDAKAKARRVREMRVHVGAGDRVYLTQHGGAMLVPLCGGDTSGQQRDIERARRMVAELDGG